ncbi:MAG TPA: GNAT family protein [Ilumatobacteraceae bacterium]|nr:GNAT family protein [Ilumatobacteraceae bacterium]
MGNDHWPLLDLEVRTPRLSLRYLDDVLAELLLAVAAAGVHDPATMPFTIPWTDLPSPQMEQEAMRFYWTSRADTRPGSWNLLFAVVVDDTVIGSIDLRSNDFPRLREFGTGSWIGREFQGRGYGKELRAAALALGFDGLGAEVAHTSAWHDNAASLGVTRSLGYEPVGTKRALRRGEPDEQLTFRMSRDHWATIRRDDITLHGIDAAREFLGVSA